MNPSRNATPAGGLKESIDFHGPTWVYHCFCVHGSTLYVGIAASVTRRMRQHRATKPWWPDVDCVVADLYRTRAEALDVEAHYIRWGNQVLHNIAGTLKAPPVPHSWIQRRDVDLDHGLHFRDYVVLPDQRMLRASTGELIARAS